MSESELEQLEQRLALRSALQTSPQLRAQILRRLGAARGRERGVRSGAGVAAGFSLLVALALALASTAPHLEERELRAPLAVVAPNLAAELGLDVREERRMQLLLADARVQRIAPPMESPAFEPLEEQ